MDINEIPMLIVFWTIFQARLWDISDKIESQLTTHARAIALKGFSLLKLHATWIGGNP